MKTLNDLVSIKSLCGATPAANMQFYLDDIEGMSAEQLAQLATLKDISGTQLFSSLRDSAVRLMLADIDSAIPTNYRIKQEIASICSSCTFSGFFSYATAQGTGIIVKNMSNSRFSSMIIDSLKVKTSSTGNFTLIIQDANLTGSKEITMDFVAGQELSIINIAYETLDTQVNIFFTDPTVQLNAITCPTGSTCGCGGAPKTLATDIIVSGYVNGIESSTQYGILPCVKIRCSYDGIISDLITASPRLFGLSLLYLTASKAFEENVQSQRVNRTASFGKEEKQSLSDYYYQLYRDRFTGNPKKGILGIASVVSSNLKIIKDKCVSCDNPNQIAWAVG
jgi:hypothetical protein